MCFIAWFSMFDFFEEKEDKYLEKALHLGLAMQVSNLSDHEV